MSCVAGPAPIASEVRERIASLYRIETEFRGLIADERGAVRKEESRLIADLLKPSLTDRLSLISQQTVLASATRCALS